MPYETEHMLLQWKGSFADSASTQSTDGFVGSLRFIGPGLATADSQIGLERMAAALRAFWLDGTDNFIPYNARLEYVKWNRIGTNGRYVNKTSTRELTYPTPAVTANSATYPQQVALAVSWLTDIQRGKGSRGRTFFPTNITLDPTIGMRVSAANCKKVANKYVQLISRLNFAASNVLDPAPPAWSASTPQGNPQDIAVHAAILSSSGTGGGSINRARVGNRLDIQRRRDNATEEEYESTGL